MKSKAAILGRTNKENERKKKSKIENKLTLYQSLFQVLQQVETESVLSHDIKRMLYLQQWY